MPIRNLYARQIFDCLGVPTVEVDLITELGLFRASSPAGVTGSKVDEEALDLRDNEKNNYFGFSVFNAIDNVNETIAPELQKSCLEVTQQSELDHFLIDLDGSDNKSRIGVNAITAVSIAIAKAGAAKRGVPLYRHIADLAGHKNYVMPVPSFHVISGGDKGGNKTPFEQFHIMPTGATSFAEAMKMGTEVYQWLKKLLTAKYGTMAWYTTEEGAFSPNFKKPVDLLNMLTKAIESAKYRGKVELGIDFGAATYEKPGGKYDLNYKAKKSNPKTWLTADKLFKQYQTFLTKYPICSIEDPFGVSETSWKDWKMINEKLTIQVVSDALTVSNPERIKQAIEKEACNSISLKLNQIGTVTELIQANLLAKQNGFGTLLSHRGGDTEDTYLADIAVGIKCGQIKCGAPCGSERTAKYNQLLRIEEELGPMASYAGKAFQNPS